MVGGEDNPFIVIITGHSWHRNHRLYELKHDRWCCDCSPVGKAFCKVRYLLFSDITTHSAVDLQAAVFLIKFALDDISIEALSDDKVLQLSNCGNIQLLHEIVVWQHLQENQCSSVLVLRNSVLSGKTVLLHSTCEVS
jgi:hypothetical protein